MCQDSMGRLLAECLVQIFDLTLSLLHLLLHPWASRERRRRYARRLAMLLPHEQANLTQHIARLQQAHGQVDPGLGATQGCCFG